MPSTYAHYRMGQEVKEKLRGEERRIIAAHSELYLIGLHGPDIFFYYKPLRIHPINQIGYGTHGRAVGRIFWLDGHLRKGSFLYGNCHCQRSISVNRRY